MPTYEYRCDKGHEFEVFQRMSETPVEKCIHCGARAERLLSAGAGLLFKGSGFYITDYRSDKYKKAAEADKGTAAPKSETSKSDATPKSDSSSKGESSPKGDSSTTGSSGSD
jgi:putative FmdB family regulatory protein